MSYTMPSSATPHPKKATTHPKMSYAPPTVYKKEKIPVQESVADIRKYVKPDEYKIQVSSSSQSHFYL
jgi:hypothetical protein